jgi:D-alanyl-D-alanine carboxypeptidase
VFCSLFRNGWSQLWLSGLVLWMVAGSVLAQEGWRMNAPPEIAARAAMLMNPVTGEVMYAKEPHLRLPPASTTKVLTAVVVLERLHPYSRVRVSPGAASTVPSRIGLRAGEVVSTQDLLYGLMLKSGNDAAETLAEAAGGSVHGFSGLMNARAWQIGARNSHFVNPHGLPDDTHYSTAYDLALIFRHAMRYSLFADIVRTRNAALRIESGHGPYGDWRMVPVRSTNRLLGSYEGARGGKTGFTRKARRCFVGEVERGGTRLIVVVLNSPSSDTLWRDTQNLLDYGFSRYGLAPPPARSEPRPIMARSVPVLAPSATARATAARPAVAPNRNRTSAAKTTNATRSAAVPARSKVAARPASSRTAASAKAKATSRTVTRTSKPVAAAGKTATRPARSSAGGAARSATAKPTPTKVASRASR